MRRHARCERGQTTAEYLGLLVVVVAVIVAVQGSPVGRLIGDAVKHAVCRIALTDGCVGSSASAPNADPLALNPGVAVRGSEGAWCRSEDLSSSECQLIVGEREAQRAIAHAHEVSDDLARRVNALSEDERRELAKRYQDFSQECTATVEPCLTALSRGGYSLAVDSQRAFIASLAFRLAVQHDYELAAHGNAYQRSKIAGLGPSRVLQVAGPFVLASVGLPGGGPWTGGGEAQTNPARGRFDTEHTSYDSALESARDLSGQESWEGPINIMIDPETGTLIGRETADEVQGWRIDYGHVNWWDWSKGKKASGGAAGHEYYPQEQTGPHSQYKGYADWEPEEPSPTGPPPPSSRNR